jgi:hypothetical protein
MGRLIDALARSRFVTLGLAAVALAGTLPLSPISRAHAETSTGATKITDCSDDVQLQDAVAGGGSYEFACTGTILLTKTLVVSSDLSLAVPGVDPKAAVTISALNLAPGRVLDIEGGTVSLTGLTITGGALFDYGDSGTDGSNGQDSQDPAQPGQPGGDGGPGASPSASLQGGGIYVASGTTLALTDDVVDGNVVTMGAGAGGRGGYGGNGANSTNYCGCVAEGDGGNGGAGGQGGSAAGEVAQGGGLFVAPGATVTLVADTFTNDHVAVGGGTGGTGGPGGVAGSPASNGTSGAGGSGGGGGQAQGGAIYVSASASVTAVGTTIGGIGAADYAWAPGGSGGYSGGAAGSGGGGGTAQGGGIYNAGTLSLDDTTFSHDYADAEGGAGGSPGSPGGTGGHGGSAAGGAVFTTTALTGGCATFDFNHVESPGGPGGPNGSNGAPGTANGADIEGSPAPPSCPQACGCSGGSCPGQMGAQAPDAGPARARKAQLPSTPSRASRISSRSLPSNLRGAGTKLGPAEVPGSQEAVIYANFNYTSEEPGESQHLAKLKSILESENYHVTVYQSGYVHQADNTFVYQPETATLGNFVSAASAGVLIISSHGARDDDHNYYVEVEDYGNKTQGEEALAAYEADPRYHGLLEGTDNGGVFGGSDHYYILLNAKGIAEFFKTGSNRAFSQLIFAGTCWSWLGASTFGAANYFGYTRQTTAVANWHDWDLLFGRLSGHIGEGRYRNTLSAWSQGGYTTHGVFREALRFRSTLSPGEGLVLSPAVSEFTYPDGSDQGPGSRAGPFVIHFDARMNSFVDLTEILHLSHAKIEGAKWLSPNELSFSLKKATGCSSPCLVKGWLVGKTTVAESLFGNWLDGNTYPLAGPSGVAPNGDNFDFRFTFR